MKMLCLLALCLFALPHDLRAGDAVEVVVYADESYPPYSYQENGELKGIYPAIFTRVFARMPDFKVQIKPVSWKRGLMLLETGQGLALFPPYYRPTERPYMQYSEPVLAEQLTVFCSNKVLAARKSHTIWPGDFYGLRIGINSGFSSGGELYRKAVQEGRMIEDTAPSNRSNLLKMLLGRIDCYINDRLSILWELERIRAEGLMEEGSRKLGEALVLSQEQGFLGLTNRDHGNFPFKAEFLRQVNQQLGEMKKNGELQKIIESQLSK